MLDEQLKTNPDFGKFLNPKFVVLRRVKTDPEGESLWKKYSVRSTPTLIVAEVNGDEIDRAVGYSPPPEKFFKNIERMYDRIDTFGELKKRYDDSPDDLAVTLKLANRYMNVYFDRDKAESFYKKIVKRKDEARRLTAFDPSLGRDVNVYEQASFYLATRMSGVSGMQDFFKEFPETEYMNSLAIYLGSYYAYQKKQSGDGDRLFEAALKKATNTETVFGYYLTYLESIEKGSDRAFNVVEEFYRKDPAGPAYANAYAVLLEKNGRPDKISEVYGGAFFERMDKENASALNNYARFWIPRGENLEAARKAEDLYLKKYWDSASALNSYAWYWAEAGKNVDRSIEVSKRSLELSNDPYYWHTLATLYWKKEDYPNAVKNFEKAIEINPSYTRAKNDLKTVRAEMKKKGGL